MGFQNSLHVRLLGVFACSKAKVPGVALAILPVGMPRMSLNEVMLGVYFRQYRVKGEARIREVDMPNIQPRDTELRNGVVPELPGLKVQADHDAVAVPGDLVLR